MSEWNWTILHHAIVRKFFWTNFTYKIPCNFLRKKLMGLGWDSFANKNLILLMLVLIPSNTDNSQSDLKYESSVP